MPISPRASEIGLPALRASSVARSSARSSIALASRWSSAERSPGATARQAGNARLARSTAASVSSTPARGSSAITCSVAGSITAIASLLATCRRYRVRAWRQGRRARKLLPDPVALVAHAGCSPSTISARRPRRARSTPSSRPSRTCRAGCSASASRSSTSSTRWSGTGWRAATTCSRSTWTWSRCPATRWRTGRTATGTSGSPRTCRRCGRSPGSTAARWFSPTSSITTALRWSPRPARS